MNYSVCMYIFVMAAVTYLIRMLLETERRKNRELQCLYVYFCNGGSNLSDSYAAFGTF